MHTFIDNLSGKKSGSPQDCVVLAFTGRQMKVFCSLPDQNNAASLDMGSLPAGVVPGEDNPDAAFGTCIADINQNAKIINKKLAELSDLVHELANAIRQYED